MGIDLTPRCVKCGCELELGKMKALPDGKGYMCTDCYETGKSPSSPFTVNKDRLRPIPKESPKTEEPSDYIAAGEDIFNQKEYVCNSCGYQFKRSSDSAVGVCPYCGKRDVSQKVEETADAYLDDDY